jgi:hypothetical protein
MTDAERVERLEFLLESAEKMVDTHLQARMAAENAVAGLAREATYQELQRRVQQLETQLELCHKAALKGREAELCLKDLRPEDYVYSPALEQILFLYDNRNPLLMYADSIRDGDPETTDAPGQAAVDAIRGQNLVDAAVRAVLDFEAQVLPPAKDPDTDPKEKPFKISGDDHREGCDGAHCSNCGYCQLPGEGSCVCYSR